MTAIDASPAALAIAAANAAEHGVAGQIEFLQGDLLAGLPATQKFDFILSNPPYVSTAEMERLSPEVKKLRAPRGLSLAPWPRK